MFANHKGGVAKTTSVCMAAQLFARAGRSVMVIDVDSQGNSSEALCPAGMSPVELPSVDVCLEDAEKTSLCAVQTWHKNIMLMAASISMERPFPTNSTEGKMITPFLYKVPVDSILKIRAHVDEMVDVILIDTAPSLAAATQAALFAADLLILPCSPAKHAVFGLPDMISVASSITSAPHKVLITLADNRTRLDTIGRQQMLVKFDCIGEVPKVSRIAENLYQKRFILGKVKKEDVASIEELFEKIYQLALLEYEKKAAVTKRVAGNPGSSDAPVGASDASVDASEALHSEATRSDCLCDPAPQRWIVGSANG